jgi:hypothetical protein
MLRRHDNKDQIAKTPGLPGDLPGIKAKRAPAGQVFLEYVIVVGVIVLIMFAMSTLIKRGAQGMVKVMADQIGNQINAEQQFDGNGGFLESSFSSTRSSSNKNKTEFVGDTTYTFGVAVVTDSVAVMNLGFTAEDQ